MRRPTESPQSSPPVVVTTPSGPTSFVLTPVADTYVNAASTGTNYGASSTLRADGSPEVLSYLRFDLSSLSGTIANATLRVFANSALSGGIQARGVADTTWGEMSVTYLNRPPVGPVVATSSAIPAGTWVELDVTSVVGPGLRSLAITTASSTAISLASRESANRPELVITVDGG